MNNEELNDKQLGRKMIETAVNLDEALVEILKLEVRRLKILLKSDSVPEGLQSTSNIIKNIIIALTLTDDRIRTGIDLCSDDSKTSRP
ncbi:MAG: hypothetical protein PHS13_08370 [Firmicutes bacterium]|nr:hypothetical protein [Bacillota bacterium]MDD3297955.1 hypothetical protein [Bacillota bacterium]MDD3851613.1 hypothetical protein [Bacillota bacterium]